MPDRHWIDLIFLTTKSSMGFGDFHLPLRVGNSRSGKRHDGLHKKSEKKENRKNKKKSESTARFATVV